MRKSNHAIDTIDATHWSIYAQVPKEEQGKVAETSRGKPGYVPGILLNKEGTARLTRANDPARGLLYCNRCGTHRLPAKQGSRGYACSECSTFNIRIVVEPTGDYAMIN